MIVYHFNPATGEPGRCEAKVQCRFGEGAIHYDSADSARIGYEAKMSEQNVSESLKKPSKGLDFAAAAAANRIHQEDRAASRLSSVDRIRLS